MLVLKLLQSEAMRLGSNLCEFAHSLGLVIVGKKRSFRPSLVEGAKLGKFVLLTFNQFTLIIEMGHKRKGVSARKGEESHGGKQKESLVGSRASSVSKHGDDVMSSQGMLEAMKTYQGEPVLERLIKLEEISTLWEKRVGRLEQVEDKAKETQGVVESCLDELDALKTFLEGLRLGVMLGGEQGDAQRLSETIAVAGKLTELADVKPTSNVPSRSMPRNSGNNGGDREKVHQGDGCPEKRRLATIMRMMGEGEVVGIGGGTSVKAAKSGKRLGPVEGINAAKQGSKRGKAVDVEVAEPKGKLDTIARVQAIKSGARLDEATCSKVSNQGTSMVRLQAVKYLPGSRRDETTDVKAFEHKKGPITIASDKAVKPRVQSEQVHSQYARMEVWSKLRGLRHKGTLKEYVIRFRRLMFKVSSLTEEDAFFTFMFGLKPWAKKMLERREVKEFSKALITMESIKEFGVKKKTSKAKPKPRVAARDSAMKASQRMRKSCTSSSAKDAKPRVKVEQAKGSKLKMPEVLEGARRGIELFREKVPMHDCAKSSNEKGSMRGVLNFMEDAFGRLAVSYLAARAETSTSIMRGRVLMGHEQVEASKGNQVDAKYGAKDREVTWEKSQGKHEEGVECSDEGVARSSHTRVSLPHDRSTLWLGVATLVLKASAIRNLEGLVPTFETETKCSFVSLLLGCHPCTIEGYVNVYLTSVVDNCISDYGAEMVESWFGSSWWNPRKSASESTDKVVLGILAFEVAGFMSKVVNLWHSLDDREILRLREEIEDSIGIQGLLGKKCTDPVYHHFEAFVNDPFFNNLEWFGWEYREEDGKGSEENGEICWSYDAVGSRVEVLAELEQSLRRMQRNPESDRVKLLEFQQKSFSKSMKCQTNKHLKSHYYSTSLHGKLLNSRTKQAGHVAFGPFKGCMSAEAFLPFWRVASHWQCIYEVQCRVEPGTGADTGMAGTSRSQHDYVQSDHNFEEQQLVSRIGKAHMKRLYRNLPTVAVPNIR
ncbi:DNA binding protein, putative isoform 1 [Hibiscus syriacus]|uniref:DNA binding protein, putative isoform 1 n=1 Tax=Hibiscus syriacus TaxID=106335 RepID=A0A6A2X6Z5_HIBSY|nr:DNA binding protein, putative isoform 1 [Hibiscus syriacus]